jgi:hypothetical protein
LAVPWNKFRETLLKRQGDHRLEENGMRSSFKKIGIAAAAAVAIMGASAALPSAAQAQHWHGGGGHWHGGGGHWHGGGFGWGFGSGLALGFGAPYYGGYYGPYAYDYGGPYAYAGDCVMRRRWVYVGNGHRVLRWRRVCY